MIIVLSACLTQLIKYKTMKIYINFIDDVIPSTLPSEENGRSLYDFVKLYQVRKHSKSCGKYKNKSCRCGFDGVFIERTIAAKPLDDSINDVERYCIMQKRETILSTVNNFVNSFLNPSKETLGEDLLI